MPHPITAVYHYSDGRTIIVRTTPAGHRKTHTLAPHPYWTSYLCRLLNTAIDNSSANVVLLYGGWALYRTHALSSIHL